MIGTASKQQLGRGMVALAVTMLALLASAATQARAGFGVQYFDGQLTANTAGDPYTQAGGHPYQFSTEIVLNHETDPDAADIFTRFGQGQIAEGGSVKDIVAVLPPGLIGDLNAIPRCTAAQLAGGGGKGLIGERPSCPVDSAVGTITLRSQAFPVTLPVYNMAPPPGVPAAFGFQVLGTPLLLLASVRDGGDYGVTVTSKNIPASLRFWGAEVTLWGVPGDPSHDVYRCDSQGLGCEPHASSLPPAAFLTVPTRCTAPGEGLLSTVKVDSWENAGVFSEASFFTHLTPNAPEPIGAQVGLSGCEAIPFNPTVSAQPTSSEAASPTGMDVVLSLPQEGLTNPSGIATSDLRDASFTLPVGMAISPSAADGLTACTQAQAALDREGPAACPEAAKIGAVQIQTPLLEAPLTGGVYLAAPSDNPFGSLLALYLVAHGSGVDVKLAGRIEANPNTGQLGVSFADAPQLPFSRLELMLKSGPRAPLVNPSSCGSYTTSATLTPWSGSPAVARSDTFAITEGPSGSACAARGFSPSLRAGTVNPQAGSSSEFSLTLSRSDQDQAISGVSVKLPPGLTAVLRDVPLCGEPQASAGTCSAASLVGHTTVGAGPGTDPFYLGGQVFLTGPYKGAPYGLSIIVPAVAGPFDLGTVVVRARIQIDPRSTQVTVTADPLPTILQGIPLDLRSMNVAIDRQGFILNPTNCEPLAISATISSADGATAALSNRFQAADCAALQFKPQFSASTSAHTSREGGASLDVRLGYPAGPLGSEANIAKVSVELPKELPSRLTTLQKACSDGVFESNPAACPSASKIGEAIATTPIMPVPLSGPAYFVSHGGAKFPELVIVLSGYGTTVQLHGETFINRSDITSSTFSSLPDLPLSSFELKLPQGPDSALAANGDLCAKKLSMPTTITAQNGAVIEQDTPISVQGCAPKIRVLRHSVKGRWATVLVAVPSAGRLVAGGGGVEGASRRVGKAGTITLELRLTKSEQRFVARHHGRRLKVPITLSFTPSRGGKLKAMVAVLMR